MVRVGSMVAGGKHASKTAAVATEAASRRPLFTFGILSDVQYADVPDGTSFAGTPRYYRHSLTALSRAVDDWHGRDLLFSLHLGDLLDGKARDHSERALAAVLAELGRLDRPVYHVIGNHDLYNFTHTAAAAALGIAPLTPPCAAGAGYYAVRLAPGWQLVVLDGYDVSMLGWDEEHAHYKQAAVLLKRHNPNEEKNDPSGLQGSQRRWVKFGGAVGRRQLAWLEGVLRDAGEAGERVIVACHLPLQPGTSSGTCLLWNYEEVLALLRAHECVAATLSGHAHHDGGAVDEAGLGHRVVATALECLPGSMCHGRIEVYEDCLQLVGSGCMGSCTLPLRPLQRPRRASMSAEVAQVTDAVVALSLHGGE